MQLRGPRLLEQHVPPSRQDVELLVASLPHHNTLFLSAKAEQGKLARNSWMVGRIGKSTGNNSIVHRLGGVSSPWAAAYLGQLKQTFGAFRVGHRVDVAVEADEREGHLAHAGTQGLSGGQVLVCVPGPGPFLPSLGVCSGTPPI
jgi:hypothetical protein